MGEVCSACSPLNSYENEMDPKSMQSKVREIFSEIEIEDTTLSIDRIKSILNVYDQFIKNKHQCKYDNINEGMHEKIASLYPSSNIGQFIVDYNHLVTNMQANNYYMDGVCNINDCNFIARSYRNLRKLAEDDTARSKLYHSQNSEKDIVVSQILDSAHNLLFHIYDMGYKLKEADLMQEEEHKHDSNEDEIDDESNESLCNQRFTQMMTIIRRKKDHFTGLRPDITDKNNTKQKFVINVSSRFCFGFRYYYHTYYKNNNKTNEILSERLYEPGNVGFCYQDWYIAAKYKSLKDEILNNNIFTLRQKYWENTLTKAKIKWKTLANNCIANAAWELIYNIKKGSVIRLDHIIGILLYCNFTELNYHFTATYRQLTDDETSEEIKHRHSEYAIWGKLLREAIEAYGTWLHQSQFDYFYTGLSSLLLFKSFTHNIHCPFSTSVQREVALNFADNGIVIEIKNERGVGIYFNCVSWSDFPQEDERLFVGGLMPLSIMGLFHVAKSIDYTNYIRAMVMFDRCVHGSTSKNGEKLLQRYAVCGSKLVKKRLNIYDKLLPQYMVELFDEICDNIKSVKLDVGLLNVDFAHNLSDVWNKEQGFGDCYGYKRWRKIFIDENGGFKLKNINKLFPNSTSFMILCREPVKNKNNTYKYSASIKINKILLRNILNCLKSSWCNWEKVLVFNPMNTAIELKTLISQQNTLYSSNNYVIKMSATRHDLRFRICDKCICIEGV